MLAVILSSFPTQPIQIFFKQQHHLVIVIKTQLILSAILRSEFLIHQHIQIYFQTDHSMYSTLYPIVPEWQDQWQMLGIYILYIRNCYTMFSYEKQLFLALQGNMPIDNVDKLNLPFYVSNSRILSCIGTVYSEQQTLREQSQSAGKSHPLVSISKLTLHSSWAALG